MKAVIDRIENGIAVVLVGEDQAAIHVPEYFLPDGARKGTWLLVRFSIDEETTARQFRRNTLLLDRLKGK